jgi:hypothetical protein
MASGPALWISLGLVGMAVVPVGISVVRRRSTSAAASSA